MTGLGNVVEVCVEPSEGSDDVGKKVEVQTGVDPHGIRIVVAGSREGSGECEWVGGSVVEIGDGLVTVDTPEGVSEVSVEPAEVAEDPEDVIVEGCSQTSVGRVTAEIQSSVAAVPMVPIVPMVRMVPMVPMEPPVVGAMVGSDESGVTDGTAVVIHVHAGSTVVSCDTVPLVITVVASLVLGEAVRIGGAVVAGGTVPLVITVVGGAVGTVSGSSMVLGDAVKIGGSVEPAVGRVPVPVTGAVGQVGTTVGAVGFQMSGVRWSKSVMTGQGRAAVPVLTATGTVDWRPSEITIIVICVIQNIC